MGHIRLGRIPKTYKWRTVFDAFENEDITAKELAQSISKSAQEEFLSLKGDNSLSFCYWVLVSIVSAARSDSFTESLELLGIKTSNINSGLLFLKNIAQFVSESLIDIGNTNVFSNIAELTLNETLSNSIIRESKSLFGTSIEDIESACKKFGTKKRFAQLSREFFSIFLTRSILFITDKELSNYVIKNTYLKSSFDVLTFQNSLSLYCYQSSKIIEDFSGGWFSKQIWKTDNKIPYDAAKGFMAYALEKVNMELREG